MRCPGHKLKGGNPTRKETKMSYKTVTLFADIKNGKFVPVDYSANNPSSLLYLAIQYGEYIGKQRKAFFEGGSDIDFDWCPESLEDLIPLYGGEEIHLQDLCCDAIAIAAIDYNNMMSTSICGATYRVCTCESCRVEHPFGEISEKLFPQNCTLMHAFERRLRDYINSRRVDGVLRKRNIMNILQRQ